MCLSPHCSLWINWGDDRVKCSHDWWLLLKSNILSPRCHLAELGLEREKAFNMSWSQEIPFKAAFGALAQLCGSASADGWTFWVLMTRAALGEHVFGHSLEFSHLQTMMWGWESADIFHATLIGFATVRTLLLSYQRAEAHLENPENLTWFSSGAARTAGKDVGWQWPLVGPKVHFLYPWAWFCLEKEVKIHF